MQRIWLVFAQSVTIVLAVFFVVSTLKPQWLAQGDRTQAQPAIAVAPPSVAPLHDAVPTYSSAAQRALPSVVHIFTSQEIPALRHPFLNDPLFQRFFGEQAPQRRSGLGSGVIVSSDGYILTNNHVIESADQIEVALNDGSKFAARVVGRDPETDLAVLKVARGTGLPRITFADGAALRVGDVVLAIGNPFGVGQTVTMGIVSALGRSQLGINTFENFIQTDAAINPGNSGGALVDANGFLVGINTAIYSRSGGSLGIGFAIPGGIARDVMQQLIRTGSVTRGWIGVQVQEITADLAETFQLPPGGALIAGIARNGPADQGGVKPGDLLLSIDGNPIRGAQSVLETVAALPPGRKVKLTLSRRGKEIESVVQIGRRPPPSPDTE